MKKLILLLVVFVLILAGCSSVETVDDVEMVAYESVKGEVMIPVEPQKIVTDLYTGVVLSLGAPLVGADLTYSSPAWEGYLDDVTDVGQSVEAVAALEPDLIITAYPDFYEQYSTIAPTIYLPYEDYNEEEIITEIGKITGYEEEATKVLEEFNNDVEEIATLIDHPELTYSVVEFTGDPVVYGHNYGRYGYVIYEKLGLSGTPEAEETILNRPDSYILLTEETITDYVGDVLLISSPGAKEVNNQMLESEVFKTTSAYQNDRIYYIDSDLFYFTDPLSLNMQAEVFKVIVSSEDL